MEDKENFQDLNDFNREIKMFSNKSKIANTEQKIETFKQSKKYFTNFIIKFEPLAIKVETNDMYTIFLLKKNVRTEIIKTILGYLLMVVPETLREQKVAIISVRQEYKFTES